GFNLTGLFSFEWENKGYTEDEFRLVHQLGYNFVRLPVDYRTYTAENWLTFDETSLQKIDHAIEWGQKYHVHVCLNLHRAPGYCVNKTQLPPDEDLDLWTDTIAQNVFYAHWKMFAERYETIPYEDLSFNLVNEPGETDSKIYSDIARRAIEIIHEVNPERLVMIDGLDYAREPVYELVNEKNVMQAFHMYDPFNITHYKASWINGSDTWPSPVWPMHPFSSYLYGSHKAEYKSPLVVLGDFTAGTKVIVNVQQVSIRSRLVITGNSSTLFDKTLYSR
ncbi:MAG: glycoside hydrolase family 5 protein, partial [Bacteroidales bacterium]|nr:glycoside hydrolase family 5 protein [Bacteroidales bacterium]